MKRQSRKIFAALAAVGGFVLIWFELREFHGDFEQWFWLAVGGLAIALAGFELFQRT